MEPRAADQRGQARHELAARDLVQADAARKEQDGDGPDQEHVLERHACNQDRQEHQGGEEEGVGVAARQRRDADDEDGRIDIEDLARRVRPEEGEAVDFGELVQQLEFALAVGLHGPCEVHDHRHLDDFEDVDLEAAHLQDAPGAVDRGGLDGPEPEVQVQ